MNGAIDSLNQRFLSVEGIEGVGKTSVIQHIQEFFVKKNIQHILSREPGGTPLAEAIRAVLLAKHPEVMCTDTELLLMFAGRAQNIQEVIKPALAEGKWVISDRFTDSTLAYQGGGREVGLQRISELAHWVHGALKPAYTLLLDAPVEISMQRLHGRGSKDRIESESNAFFKRVRAAYLQLASAEPERYVVIDATQPLVQVLSRVEKHLDVWLQVHCHDE